MSAPAGHEPRPRQRARAGRRPGPALHVERRVRAGWQPTRPDFRGWAGMALGRAASRSALHVRLVGPAESRALNARHRGQDHATNVLSFPALPSATRVAGWLGDLVFCPALVRAEARAQRKSVRAHWAHLVVHGVLHLLGFEHERPAQARRMERREIACLRRLGIANPYLPTEH
jgi:probable rRNA maturation factor